MFAKGEIVLACENVSRTLGGRRILENVSLSLRRGAHAALLGPSGCGKTTLLQLLGLLDRPDEGRVFLDGVNVATLRSSAHAGLRLSRLGYVFQTGNLLGHLSALDNVALPARRLGMGRREARISAEKLLERFDLSGQKDAPAATLSPGEAQRVAIARALVNKPAALLCDEPTGSLDAASADQVMSALADARDLGAALLVVTHDGRVAAAASECWQLDATPTPY